MDTSKRREVKDSHQKTQLHVRCVELPIVEPGFPLHKQVKREKGQHNCGESTRKRKSATDEWSRVREGLFKRIILKSSPPPPLTLHLYKIGRAHV